MNVCSSVRASDVRDAPLSRYALLPNGDFATPASKAEFLDCKCAACVVGIRRNRDPVDSQLTYRFASDTQDFYCCVNHRLLHNHMTWEDWEGSLVHLLCESGCLYVASVG